MELLRKILLLPVDAIVWLSQAFLRRSLPARIAWAVAGFQTLIVVLALAAIFGVGGMSLFRAWWSLGKGLALLVLLLVVPVLVYQAARLWLRHESVRWPDIDAAWKAALIEIQRQQVDIKQTPLFLVLGCDGREVEQAIMQEAPVSFVVVAAPPGSAPLHVYAGHEAVFVCLSAIGQVAAVAGAFRRNAFDEGLAAARPAERAEAADRLVAICQRISNIRQPIAPINGILAFLPLPAAAPQPAMLAAGIAIGEDVSAITTAFGLRVPLVVAGTGLEQLRSFENLLAQLPAAERKQALGELIPPSQLDSASVPAALAARSCGGMVNLIREQLLDPRSASQPALNRALAQLLVAAELHLIPAVEGILTGLLGHTSHGSGLPLMAGFALAAVSPDAEKRGFLRGLFEHMLALQGDLEWTAANRRQNSWAERAAWGMRVVNIVMILAIVGIVTWRLWR